MVKGSECPLAVYSPNIGVVAETFIRRYMCRLLPGQSVALAKNIQEYADGSEWRVDGPQFVFSQVSRPTLKRQVYEAIAWHAGLRFQDPVHGGLRKFLRAHGVRVLLSNYLDESLALVDLAREEGIRLFVHGHGYDVSQYLLDESFRKAYQVFNRVGGVIVVSEYSKRRLIDAGLDGCNIHVVPPGCEEVPQAPIERSPGEVVQCLALGSMVGKKAPIMTLDAFRRALEVCPELRLDYVGDGSMFLAARHYVQANRLEPHVRLWGRQPDSIVAELRAKADVFLQHSMTNSQTGDEEGLPVTLLEMMAYSIPVVSTRHAGIPEAVLDGETGFLVDEGDSRAMGERIVQLARDPGLRCQMGAAGWTRVRDGFTWEDERRRLLTIMGLDRQGG